MTAVESPPPEAPPERRCRRCGSSLGPDQEWCLACGAAASTRIAPPRGWPFPIALAALLTALAVAAAVLAIVQLSRGPERVAQVTPSATPAPPAQTPVQATPTPAPPTTSATPAPSTAQPVPPTAQGAFPDWPPGSSGWTIVLASAPKQATAKKLASDLRARGDGVGILRSDAHPPLPKGYWLVFSGEYPSRTQAQAALTALPAKRPGAYVRHISR